MVDEFPQAQVMGEGGRKEQPGIGHQPVVVEKRHECGRGGCVVASIGCSLFWGRFAVTKPLSQIHGGTLSLLQGLSLRPSFGGFGLMHTL